ncbi:MAG: hypothetical protein IKV32_07290 [Muribaculaceae bacterium]|nr:hypothetical protein [Muribaculaceae bacterium]
MRKLKVYSMLAVFATMSVLSSCTFHNPDEISCRDIVKEYNRVIEEQVSNMVTVPVMIGKYECNDEGERYALRQLEAAGLITYDVERLAWWEKAFKNVKHTYTAYEYYGWYSYPVEKTYWDKKESYDFEDHYIVTVALTDKGKKLVIEEFPTPEGDKDMKQPEINYEEYAWVKADLSEEWPYIENPFLKKEKKEEKKEEVSDSPVNNYTAEEEPKDKIERIDEAQYKKYKAFAPEVECVTLLAYKTEAVKARNIQIAKQENGISKATAEVIVEMVDVSDVGRIKNYVEEEQKMLYKVALTYYLDKGWVLDTNSIELLMAPNADGECGDEGEVCDYVVADSVRAW